MIDIERLAREAGIHIGNRPLNGNAAKGLSDFAALVRNEVLEEAANRCAAEKVNYELTQHAADEAYNMAVDHCAAAIRALKQ
jgi:hypothetical protein